MIRLSRSIKRTQSVGLALLLMFWQMSVPLAIMVAHSGKASAAAVCTIDTAGANDEPGQKDLTKLCVDYAGVPTTVATTWNWDETGTSGANTLDACNLFDTDGDGNINYAVCVTTTDDPATLQTTTTYSCGDDKTDRCTSPTTPISNGTTSCAVTQQNTDPFPGGASSPKDTQGACTIQLSAVGGATAKLVDVCSYPSSQPNSDPSDCVIAQPKAGKIEVVKNLIPGTDAGLFNLQVDATTKAANVGNNGTTGEVVVPQGNHSVGETAGTSTALANYASSISCKDLNGTGVVIASGAGTSLANIPVADGADIVCIITNTAAGSITIVKDAVANNLQDFAFTATGSGLSNFSLDDDNGVAGADATLSNTKTFSNLAAGSYSITETATSGWDLASINCGGAAGVTTNGATTTINLSAGQNISCTYRNEQRAQIIVTKQTNPDNDPTQFSITASGTGNIAGNAIRSISDNGSTTYDVAFGTYAVSEQVPAGWTQASNTCSNLVVNGNTPKVNGIPTLSCTINNTKYATLNIIKDALPNDPQDFAFTTTNLGGATFLLDDDSNATLPNNTSFGSLLPGSYSVTESSVPGWSMTGLTCDTNNFNKVSSTVTVNLAAGQTTNCTYTNTKLVTIAGTKYTSSATGSLGSALAGWTIFIDTNGNGVLDNGELSAVTDVNGHYSFTNLLPGSFTLNEVLLAGWTQIISPSSFSLNAGDTATNKDFGNFQNGSIGGFKWNDINGDGQLTQGEPKLSGWTMNLYRDSADPDNTPDQLVGTTQTDANGNYSFTNLSPVPSRFYAVCEVQQAGWAQTFPAGNTCHQIDIDQSGETNSNTNFGNQGRGGIGVFKNVDTNGDGQVDLVNVSDWKWDINGSGNFATGSYQDLAAGTYTVSEQQKPGYHVTSVNCSGETPANTASEQTSVTVSPGEDVTCTYVNTRDTGTLTLIKNVINNNGGQAAATAFTMHVKQNGADVAGSPAAGSATGTVYTMPTGTFTVSEDSPIAGYAQTSIICDGQPTNQVTLTTGTNKICTITNDDIAPQLTVIKHVINDNSGTLNASNFTMNVTGTNVAPNASFPGNEAGTTVTLNAGNYSVGETPVADYTSSLSSGCSGTIALGQTKICTITNTDNPHPGIHVVKSGPTTAHEGDQITYTFTVTNTGDTTLSGATVVDSITGNAVYQSGDTNNNGILEKTETWVFTTGYTIPVGQTANIVNTGTACANDPAQTQVCDTDDHTLDVLHPSISVIKSGPALAYEGTTVGYNFTVTNTGDTTLTNVGINDDIATSETCLANTLAPGAFTTCTAIYLVPTPTTNNVTNTVTASGTDSLNRTVTDQDQHTLDVIHPAINIVKSGPATAHEGDLITYTFTVTNPGDIPLSGNAVNDSIAGAATYQSGDINNNGKLDTNETWIFTKQYTIPANQTANVVNTGMACGFDPLQTQVCDTDNHTLDVLHPSLMVEKFGPATAYEGNTVNYTFKITNTGDTTLTGVGISDDIAVGETCLTSTLAAGAFTTCTASYTVPSPQIANVVNTVTACGVDPLQRQACDTDQHTLDILHPTITINKVVNPSTGDNGLFNLLIDGQAKANNIGSGGSTGAINVTPGNHTVGEAAGTNTNLADYESSMSESCGNGTVNVTGDQNVTCTITNTHLATLTITKDSQPNDPQDFNFHLSDEAPSDENELSDILKDATYLDTSFQLDDDSDPTLSNHKTTTHLSPGTYYVSEDSVPGWDLKDIDCGRGVSFDEQENNTVAVTLEAGADVNCTFTNVKRGSITIVKDAQPDSDQAFKFTGSLGDPQDEGGPNFYLTDNGQPDNTLNSRTFDDLEKGTYTVTEPNVKGWSLDEVNCTGGEDVNTNNRNAVIKLQPGENVTCTFVNTRDSGTITVHKITRPSGSDQDFTFNLRPKDGDTITHSSTIKDGESDTYNVVTGDYNLAEENIPDGWDLASASCTTGDNNEESEENATFDPRDGSFEVNKKDNIDCTFVNEQRATVIVTKFNDYNRNGQQDAGEPSLPGWEINLGGSNPCNAFTIGNFAAPIDSIPVFCDGLFGNTTNQTTSSGGTATFENVTPNQLHELTETQQDGWTLSNIDCNGNQQEESGNVNQEDDEYYLYAQPGETINCSIGNYRQAALNIEKTNNRPNPTTTGDTVTYTITVSVPENSGAVFNTTVEDLPPKNFTYVAGSWTANSNLRGDIKADGITTEPTYGSPGAWKLGTMLPGETVILTYLAKIGNTVITGTYPDVAFGIGCQTPAACSSGSGLAVLANVSTGANTPFVGTAVTIANPTVLGTTTRLINTGIADIWRTMLIAGFIVITTAATFVATRPKKGGRS